MKRHILAVAAALTTLLPPPAPADDGRPLRLGSVAMHVPAVMNERLRPLTAYLSRELGRPVHLHLSPNMKGAIDDVAAGRVDLSYMTPVAYLKAQRRGNARLVAKTLTRGQGSFRLMIVVRDDSPIRTPADLAGKNFAFGDASAVLQRAVVVNTGLRLEQLASYKFIGHYDNIARGVHSRDFDAGILKDTTAYEWEKKGLRVIYASPPLPPYAIVSAGHVDDALMMRLRAAFLRLDPRRPEDQRVITALDPNYSGFTAVSDVEYDVVRRLIKPFDP
ncbi:MAG: PhnD/SsuA/transferrin family substrate-binding protein [Pseudomonadota bacterium]